MLYLLNIGTVFIEYLQYASTIFQEDVLLFLTLLVEKTAGKWSGPKPERGRTRKWTNCIWIIEHHSVYIQGGGDSSNIGERWQMIWEKQTCWSSNQDTSVTVFKDYRTSRASRNAEERRYFFMSLQPAKDA